jgi:hypothetical protein
MVQRIEEILGTTITEYTPNAIKFRGLSLETLQQILEAGYTARSANFNAAPSVGSFIEFGQRCQSNGVTATFDGIAFAEREYPNLVVDAITIIGVKVLLGLVASTQPTILRVNSCDLFGVAMKWRLVLKSYMPGGIRDIA